MIQRTCQTSKSFEAVPVTPRPAILEMLERCKYQRHINIGQIPPADAPKTCKWCGTACKGGRRSWCSDECSDEYAVRSGSAAGYVYHRDKGVCAECGLDTDWIVRQARTIVSKHYRISIRTRDSLPYRFWRQWGPFAAPLMNGLVLWQADHIIPVVEGGGCCGLDNYQTLCTACHKKDTASLAARLAERRREPGQIRMAI